MDIHEKNTSVLYINLARTDLSKQIAELYSTFTCAFIFLQSCPATTFQK